MTPVAFVRRGFKFLRKHWYKRRFAGLPAKSDEGLICIVAIIKDEEKFIDEWLAYYRLLGVDHFILYDNDDNLPLKNLVKRHASYVTVVDWPGDHAHLPGRNVQTRAYTHALSQLPPNCSWVGYFDVDEFVVLKNHTRLRDYLAKFTGFGAVRLNWYVFGHNGHFDDPKGFVTTALTRRSKEPSIRTKTIVRPQAIESINTAHFCNLKSGFTTADANGQPYSDEMYEGKTKAVHINHYMCRSYTRWMNRVGRGDVAFIEENAPHDHRWKFDEQLCLRQFVVTVAKTHNELVDEGMLQFEMPIKRYLETLPK